MSSTPKRSKYAPSTSRSPSKRIRSNSEQLKQDIGPKDQIISLGAPITLPKLSLLISNEVESFKFAQKKGLIATPGSCINCASPMHEYKDKDKPGEVEFRCISCRKRQSPLIDTIFENTKTTLRKILLLIYLFCKKEPVSSAAIECELQRKTACRYYDYFRWVCATIVTNESVKRINSRT
jgi:hypothetical protein